MGGRTWRSSRDFYCNGLLRKRNPNIGSNGWAPAQASRSAPAPAPSPPRKAKSPASHDFVHEQDPAREPISTSSGALPRPEQEPGEAYSYYHHPKSSADEEHEEAAGVPLPASGSSSLRDLLKAEQNHHVKTRRRFEIEKSFYALQPRPSKTRPPVTQPEPARPRTHGKEPKRQRSLFKQTMMAISKYTYM